MTATWHAITTKSANEFITETVLNEQLRNNLEFLKSRPFNEVNNTSRTTTSTSFVELTGSSISLTTYGGNVLIALMGTISNNTAGAVVYLDLAIDSTRQGDTTLGLGGTTAPFANYNDAVGLAFFSTSAPSAASHSFSIYWKVSAGTGSALLRTYVMEIR